MRTQTRTAGRQGGWWGTPNTSGTQYHWERGRLGNSHLLGLQRQQKLRLLIIRPVNREHCYRLGQQSAPLPLLLPPPYIDAILPRTCIMNGWLMTLRRLRKPQPEDGRPGPRSTSGIKHAPLADPRNPRSLLHGLAVYRSNPPPPLPFVP